MERHSNQKGKKKEVSGLSSSVMWRLDKVGEIVKVVVSAKGVPSLGDHGVRYVADCNNYGSIPYRKSRSALSLVRSTPYVQTVQRYDLNEFRVPASYTD